MIVCNLLLGFLIGFLMNGVCVLAAHTAWNCTRNIIFGLPNSGIVTRFSIFRLDAASARDSFFYSVGFGVEESSMAVLVMGLVTVLILFCNKYKKIVLPKDNF